MEKKILFFQVFLITIFQLSGQTVDFNTKKGLAIHGYDVVSYFDMDPEPGNQEIKYELDGISYLFSNQDNREKFIEDPNAYLPEYGGYCAYAMATSAKKVGVNPETYEIRAGKLYLFYNSGRNNTLEAWIKESPELLIPKADANWEKVKWLRR